MLVIKGGVLHGLGLLLLSNQVNRRIPGGQFVWRTAATDAINEEGKPGCIAVSLPVDFNFRLHGPHAPI